MRALLLLTILLGVSACSLPGGPYVYTPGEVKAMVSAASEHAAGAIEAGHEHGQAVAAGVAAAETTYQSIAPPPVSGEGMPWWGKLILAGLPAAALLFDRPRQAAKTAIGGVAQVGAGVVEFVGIKHTQDKTMGQAMGYARPRPKPPKPPAVGPGVATLLGGKGVPGAPPS